MALSSQICTTRNLQIILLYKTGNYSLHKLAVKYDLSHEMIRQILLKKGHLDRKWILDNIHNRTRERRIKKWGSLENYQKEQDRLANIRFLKANVQDKWHWRYDRCLGCGRTDKPHKVGGRCSTCYQRYLYNTSPKRKAEHKIWVKKWYDNHREQYRTYSKKYHHEYYLKNIKKIRARAKIYYALPEVVARRRAYAKIYYSRPDIIAKRKAYYNNPEVKARIRARDRVYYQRKNNSKIYDDRAREI
jgi:hypothetical protein